MACPKRFGAALLLALFFYVLGTTVAKAEPAGSIEQGRLVASIEGVGDISLALKREYQGERSATLLWLFEEIGGNWSQTDGKIVFHRQPSYSRKPDVEPALVLALRPDGSWAIEEGGLFSASRAGFFARFPWRLATKQAGNGVPEPSPRMREQLKRYRDRGDLLPLPESFPAEFMDSSALLFRDREHSIAAILKHPKLSREVLDIVGDGILNGEAGPGGSFVLPLLGAHPNLSPRLQERLFALPADPPVWRAVACNPAAEKAFYDEYLKRIRDGDKNTRFSVARDKEAPREAWELAIAPMEPYVLGEFSRNPSAPPDLLAKVAEQIIISDPVGLASNPATPPEILNRLSKTQVDVYAGLSEGERKKNQVELRGKQINSNDKQVLWSIKRNPSAPAEAVERALRTLASCTSSDLRDTAADDPRLPIDVLEKLSKDPSVQVRIVLSMNKAVPLPLLEALAQDPYRMVSERARDNMKRRFPDAYAARQNGWVPLNELNPNSSLIQDFEQAVKAGDAAGAQKLLAFSDDPGIKPSPAAVVSIILADDIGPFKPLLKDSIQEGGSGALESMITNPNLTPDDLQWLADEKLLDQQMTDRMALFATEKGRTDLLERAKNLGWLESRSQLVKNTALFTATRMRSDELVDFWIKTGGDPDAPVHDDLSAAGLAAKLGLSNLLKRLDVDGNYARQLAETLGEAGSVRNTNVVGIWANKRSDSSSCALTLAPDGTGMLGTADFSFPVAWKSDGAKLLAVVLVGPKAPVGDKTIHLKYEKESDILTLDQSKQSYSVIAGGDPTPFYRIKNQ